MLLRSAFRCGGNGPSLLLFSAPRPVRPAPVPVPATSEKALLRISFCPAHRLSRVSLLWHAAFQPHTNRLGPVRRGRPPPRSRILRKAYSVDPGVTSSTPQRRTKSLWRRHAQLSVAAPKWYLNH